MKFYLLLLGSFGQKHLQPCWDQNKSQDEALISCRCEPSSNHQVSPSAATSEDGEEVRIFFPLSSPDDDVTVKCLAYNLVGESRQVFVHREYQRNPK